MRCNPFSLHTFEQKFHSITKTSKIVYLCTQGNPTLFFATFLLTTRVSLLHARARTRFFS